MIPTVRRIRRNLLAALLVVLLIGGTAAAWSIYVPLDGAVIASGIVVVESNLRKVQHPTGDVVGVLNVREGQRVEAGEVVVRLQEGDHGRRTQARSGLAPHVGDREAVPLDDLAGRGRSLTVAFASIRCLI